MSAKNLYDYTVCGAKYFLILGVLALFVGLLVLFTAPWSLKKSMDFYHIIPVVLISIFYFFVVFTFFYHWWPVRLGVSSSGLYLRHYGLIRWEDIRNFGESKRKDFRGGRLFGIWPTKWLVINLKEDARRFPDSSTAFLIGPEFTLSKKVEDIINVLREYHKKYS